MQFLLPQHVSGTNMSIIRSTISEYLPLLGGSLATSSEQCSLLAAQHYTTQATFQVWPPKSGRYSLIVLLMMDILVPETCWGNKTAYCVASSWFLTFTKQEYIYFETLHKDRSSSWGNHAHRSTERSLAQRPTGAGFCHGLALSFHGYVGTVGLQLGHDRFLRMSFYTHCTLAILLKVQQSHYSAFKNFINPLAFDELQ
jgi:hypothetical protein